MKLFRVGEAFRILTVAAMMTCVASAVLELVARVLPGFDPVLLVLLAPLVCLEGIATDRLARQLPDASLRLRLHLVEWVVILLLLRLALVLAQGIDALGVAAAYWLAHPTGLFDGGLIGGAALLFIVWWLGIAMSRGLEALGPEAEAPPPRDSAAYYAWITRPRVAQRAEGWENLVRLFLMGGMVVLVASGLSRLDVQAALSLRNPAIAGILGNVLGYFALGFVLLAHGQYAALRQRWEREGVPVAAQLPRRWTVLAVLFTVMVAMLALLLPTRPSLKLFAVAYDLIWRVVYYVWAAVMVVLALVGYLFTLLGRLLGLGPAPSSGEGIVVRFSPPQPQAPAQRLAWWEALQGLLLWALIVAAVCYAAVRFVREREHLWRELAGRRGPLGWLARVARAVWRWFAGARAGLELRWRRLVARGRQVQPADRRGRRRARYRAGTLREQVRLLYLLGLEEMGQAGRPRAVSDTPYEYAQRHAPQLEEGGEELEQLTEAFVQARYSRHEFTADEVGPLRGALRRLRDACRRLIQRT